jgi:PPM family protein phosphatase
MELRAAAVTDAGRVRSVNQDRFLIVADRIYVVADGMGGHRGGEVAAQMTVEALGTNTDSIQSTRDLVTRLEQTNQAVLDRSNDDPELRGMGTTVTAVALFNPSAKNPVLSVINVGDSRTYRMRAGELEQLTEDHSVVAELMRTGRLSPEEARGHRQRSVLTRAVGVEPTLEADTLEVLVNQGDRFLLCSDGLYTEVPDLRVAAILRQLGDPAEAAKELVRLALQNGGRDNITVLIIDVLDDRDPSYVASQSLTGEANQATFGGSSVESYAPTSNAAAKPAPPETVEKAVRPKKVKGAARKPWAINLRVVLFVAVLAALGAVVAWVVTAGKNIPADRRIITSSSTTVVSSPSSTVVGGPAIPVSTSVDANASTTAVATADNAVNTTANADPGTGATTTRNESVPLTGANTPTSVPLFTPTTLDPFDPAPKVKATPKRKAKAKSKAKATNKKRKTAVVAKTTKTTKTTKNALGLSGNVQGTRQ